MNVFNKVLMIQGLFQQYDRIPANYKSTFIKESLTLNVKNEKIIIALLTIWNFILLIIDILKYSSLWKQQIAYRNLLLAHILPLLILPVIFHIITKNNNTHQSKRLNSLLHYSILGFVVLWCSFLAINAQYIHVQISAYIIVLFCISSVIVLSPFESFIIFGFSYLLFLTDLVFVSHDPEEFRWSLINVSICVSLAFLVSVLNFNRQVSNFIIKKTAEEKTLELDTLNKKLDKMIKERTGELKTANECLILEIETRHALELQALKTKLQFEEKEKELKETVELAKLKASFFTNISHEFRTPLTVILSAVKMLESISAKLENGDDSTQINKFLVIVKQNCYRLLRLISNLIDITRIDSGHYDLKLRNYDIIKLVEDISLSVAKYAESKNINLIFDTEIEERLIACDADKIEIVVLNLLSNAIKFTPEYGNIFVNIFEEDGKIIISVKDTGIGIPREFHASVFKRFFQADNTLSRHNEGSGIGLSLVKSIVELHNGKVQIRSEAGKGSEFIIQLPSIVIEEKNRNSHPELNASNHKVDKINIEFSDIYF